MKIFKNISIWAVAAIVASSAVSCIDEIKFGDAFLEKAPGGTETEETIFGSAEYTRRFLDNIYSMQWYGIPGYTRETWNGLEDALTDCFQNHYTGFGGMQSYYQETLTSLTSGNLYACQFEYTQQKVWEAVYACWKLLERVDNVPDLDESEKKQMKAEAKCMIAARYWDTFRWYGGLPLVTGTFTGAEESYNMPRASVEETVNFMVNLLDEAAPDLRWNYSDLEASNDLGHWTKASAMALKCKILVFAASPLFNSDQPYNTETDATADQQLSWWYGNFDQSRWERALTACKEFFTELDKNGYYALRQAEGTRPEDYRLAYRWAYFRRSSTEVLHSVRGGTYDIFKGWHRNGPKLNSRSYSGTGRNVCPSQEYVEMFPWADGTPFDWDESEAQQKAGSGTHMLDSMFASYTFEYDSKNKPTAVAHLTRDPRLYETVIVNGMQQSLDWSNGNMSGNYYELWVGGSDIGQQAAEEGNGFTTGYAINKYWIDEDAYRQYPHWAYLRLSDIYLLYAEALLQCNQLTEAIKQIDIVRARVGLKGLAECNPDKNLTGDKQALLDELLRERACELGLEDSRWPDIVRYKLGDKFLTKQLHRILIYRLDDSGNRVETKWRDNKTDQKKKVAMPTHFDYERQVIKSVYRKWWDATTFATKWYLTPFPASEINKGYGCIQNPGW